MMDANNRTRRNLTFLLAIIIVLFEFFLYFKFVYKNIIKGDIMTGFSSCSILEVNCADNSCGLHYLCNEEGITNCKIYDCGKKYWVEAQDKNGMILKGYKDKFDIGKAEADVKNCGGRLAVIEKKECDNGKATAKVQLAVGDSCSISGFTMSIDNIPSMALFKKENNYYILSAGKCGAISDVTAIGEGGVQIKEYY